MDRLESLGSQLSQITMYDIKTMYNQVRFALPLVANRTQRFIDGIFQAKNVVLNVSEIEAKVREATNDDPWYVLC